MYELKSRNEAKASSNFKAVNSWNTMFGKLLLFTLIIFSSIKINRDLVPIYRFRAQMIKEEKAWRIISTNYTNAASVINQFCNLQN